MLRILIAFPFLLLLVLFALSNPQSVHLGLWPTDYTLDAPLSLTVLLAMAAAFFLGALMIWFSATAARARARRAESRARQLDVQLQDIRTRSASPALPPPT